MSDATTHESSTTLIRRDVATRGQIERLFALLDRTWPAEGAEDTVPPLGHWLYCPPAEPRSRLGPDGHPAPGACPALAGLPRRMWGGSIVTFVSPIPFGASLELRSTVTGIRRREGANGPLAIASLRNDMIANGVLALTEEQSILYRAAAAHGVTSHISKPSSLTVPQTGADGRIVVMDNVSLFRFSALTFNGHRIHYDADYAREREGYHALVVQGTLTATLLLDHFRRTNPRIHISRIVVRAERPLFVDQPIILRLGEPSEGLERIVCAINEAGDTAMTMSIT